jgi:hypothetical protein
MVRRSLASAARSVVAKKAWRRGGLVSAVGLGRFGFESVRSELIAQSLDIEKPHAVNLVAPPVSLADSPKRVDISKQSSLGLVPSGALTTY